MKSIQQCIIAAVLLLANVCVGQQNVIPQEIINKKIEIGDTVVFYFNNEISIYPHYDWKTTFDNEYHHRNRVPDHLDGYVGGYLSTHPKTDKKGKNPIFVYHAIDGKYTPSSAISRKQMILLDECTREVSSDPGDEFFEYMMFNIYDVDTVLLRNQTSILDKYKIRLFDTIRIPSLTQKLQDITIGKKYYIKVYRDDTLNYDKVINKEYYKVVTFTDADCYYRFLGQRCPDIIIKYKDNQGVMSKWENFHLPSRTGSTFYSADEIEKMEELYKIRCDSVMAAQLEAKKNAGKYHFELTKVEKKQNANSKKGIITKGHLYEDNIISINWDADEYDMRFNFVLKNMTNNTIRLLWDEALIVNFDGFTERVIHKGADLEALQKAQQPAIIPSLAQLADFYCSEKYVGGRKLLGGYCGYNNGGVNDGKEMRLILPIQIGTSTYTYSFTFSLKWEWAYPELR